jgi:hypothetical protein
MVAPQATLATTGLKGVVLFVSPTQSHPSVAHDSTINVVDVAFVMVTVPLMGTPALASVARNVKRTDTGDLALALATVTPEETVRRMHASANTSRCFMAEDYRWVLRFCGRASRSFAPE